MSLLVYVANVMVVVSRSFFLFSIPSPAFFFNSSISFIVSSSFSSFLHSERPIKLDFMLIVLLSCMLWVLLLFYVNIVGYCSLPSLSLPASNSVSTLFLKSVLLRLCFPEYSNSLDFIGRGGLSFLWDFWGSSLAADLDPRISRWKGLKSIFNFFFSSSNCLILVVILDISSSIFFPPFSFSSSLSKECKQLLDLIFSTELFLNQLDSLSKTGLGLLVYR